METEAKAGVIYGGFEDRTLSESPVCVSPRKLSIEKVLNGFIVKVGCQTVVFTDLAVLQEELGNYLAYPKETEERFLKAAKEAI